MIKKLIISLMTVILLFALVACEGENEAYRTLTTEYYKVALFYDSDDTIVYSFTDLGVKQKILAVPSHFEGRPVTQIGWRALYFGWISMRDNPNLEKIYIPYTINKQPHFQYYGGGFPKLVDVVCLSSEKFLNVEDLDDLGSRTFTLMIIAKTVVIPYMFEQEFLAYNVKVRISNTYYYYNFEGSPNSNLYWHDLILADSLYLNPDNPIRLGYTFIDWYLEPECINKWDGILPTTEDEELELYAGWEEIIEK